MSWSHRFFVLVALATLNAEIALAQAPQNPAPQKLTLKEAEAIAIRNHPQLQAANLNALAASEVTTEVRSAYYPQAYGDVTGAGALPNSRIAAGLLNNPSVFNREAEGVSVSQLITDFGRTANLSETARLQASAQQENVQATRETVLLQVDQAYFRALRAQAVLKVAQETVKARQLVVDQVTALQQSKLKSALDVSFANVNLADAQLLLVRAENDVKASFAELSQALGYRDSQQYELADEPLPPAPPADLDALVDAALRQRPELAGLRHESDAAHHFAKAERDLWLPTVSAVGVAGVVPDRQIASGLGDRYGAAGINVSIPIFNGKLFSARHAEASLRAQQQDQNLRDLENRVTRDVRVAWLDAVSAFKRLDLTQQLLYEANQAADLAQARYKLGLSSIVELSQAQLNQTQAQIEETSAKYDYQIRVASLNYQTGSLP